MQGAQFRPCRTFYSSRTFKAGNPGAPVVAGGRAPTQKGSDVMKKNNSTRIQLHRETLQLLADNTIGQVVGAATSPCPTRGTVACTVCHTC